MTSEIGPLPFLLRFAEKIPEAPAGSFRFDAPRSVSQAFIDGEWVDALDVRQAAMNGVTKLTEVGKETTDDD